jgi:hypothetical protein
MENGFYHFSSKARNTSCFYYKFRQFFRFLSISYERAIRRLLIIIRFNLRERHNHFQSDIKESF